MKKSRELALLVLCRIESSQAYANVLLDKELNASSLDGRDKALTTELVYGVLRWQKTLDWYLDQVCKKPMRTTHPWLRCLFRLGTYQLLMLERIPPSAAINETVKLAGQYSQRIKLPVRTAKGVVNAILRQIDRARRSLKTPATIDEPTRRLAVQYSFPEWMVARWTRRLGIAGAEQVCQMQNQPARVTLRVNTLKTSVEELQHQFAEHETSSVPLPGKLPGLILADSPPIATLPAYQQGECTPQNASSMLIALLLDPQPGEAVLDTCAGVGVKTTHIGELMRNQGSIMAVDIHEGKLQRLQQNARRLGISIACTACGDMSEPDTSPVSHLTDNAAFDRILIDAPCSGLGVLRKHPEAKWTKREAQIAELQQLQLRLLTQASAMLRPEHGVLVYSTCTTTPEENEEVLTQFLSTTTDFKVDSPLPYIPESLRKCVTPEGFLRIDPPQECFDGFFAARLIRC